MSRLYSQRLIGAGAVASASATVPDGVLWVVRDAILYFDGASTDDAYAVLFNYVDGAHGFLMAGQVTGGTQKLVEWQGRQVIYTGDELVFTASTDNWYVAISGYALTTP